MQFKIGMVVKSNAGHDKNRFYVLVDMVDGKGYIADGKRRKLEKPKAKNLIHLSPTKMVYDLQELNTNSKLRRELFSFNNEKTVIVAE